MGDMPPLNRLVKTILLAASASLTCSCDKLPFQNDKDTGENTAPSGKTAEKRPETSTHPSPDPKEAGKQKRPLQKGEYILYQSEQPLPVGTGFLTSTNEVKKRQMSFSSDGKESKQTGNTSTLVQVYGGFVDSDHQITLQTRKDITTETHPSEPTKEIKNPLNEKEVIISKEQGAWTARVKNGESGQVEKDALAVVAEKYNLPTDLVIYGTEPRKVGDVWLGDASKLPSLLKPGYHVQSVSTYKVHFKEVKNHQGQEYALLEMDIDLYVFITDPAVKAITDPKVIKSKMTIKGKMTTYRLLSYGISLAEQLDLVVTATEIVQTSSNYGVKKFTMTVQQNTTTELELKGE